MFKLVTSDCYTITLPILAPLFTNIHPRDTMTTGLEQLKNKEKKNTHTQPGTLKEDSDLCFWLIHLIQWFQTFFAW